MTPLKVYISGPISSIPGGNKQAFYKASLDISFEGNIPLNPHDIGAHFPEGSSWVAYMRVCIPAICNADEIVMLNGWIRSRGARIEWILARILKIKVRCV